MDTGRTQERRAKKRAEWDSPKFKTLRARSGLFNDRDEFKGFPKPDSVTDNFTAVTNEFFMLLPLLGEAELKVALWIVRQTYGWIDHQAWHDHGVLQRKRNDFISYSQFQQATGLGSQAISDEDDTTLGGVK